jgi:long-chain-fatty-acid--CoA ligase ACSBG
MISHDNIGNEIEYTRKTLEFKPFEERIVSFLPLSHVVAQLLDCYIAVSIGATVYFADPNVFKGTLTRTLAFAQPTIFFAVPRVWEKLEERISQSFLNLSGFKAMLFKWARKFSLAHIKAGFDNESINSFEFKIADKIVLSKVRRVLGLNKARIICSGAAPLSPRTTDFFIGLGITISEGFGMSELSGGITTCLTNKYRMGSVGLVNEYNRVKIADPDPTGNGEICVYGRSVFMGYLNEAEKTSEVFDADGYLRTGDIGRIDENGFLFITGRIKELIITAGGENIAPSPIENSIKDELFGVISNCMVVGDKRKFLAILITLKVSCTILIGKFTSISFFFG